MTLLEADVSNVNENGILNKFIKYKNSQTWTSYIIRPNKNTQVMVLK